MNPIEIDVGKINASFPGNPGGFHDPAPDGNKYNHWVRDYSTSHSEGSVFSIA